MFSTALNFPNFHSRPYTLCIKVGYLPNRNAQCIYCTEKAIAFLGSPYRQLPYDINIALVQRRYNCFRQLRYFPNFLSRPYTQCIKAGYLPGCNAQCVYCTENAIAFFRFWKIRSCRKQWYRLCANAMFISKGSCGYGKPKNAIGFSVQ